MMKEVIKKIISSVQSSIPPEYKKQVYKGIKLLETERYIIDLKLDQYLQDNLYNSPKYQDPKKLNRSEFKVFSQCGEDGIISEIFNRIGTTNNFFVEFGVGIGLESNSAYLLLKGWKGHWIEGSANSCKIINSIFADPIASKQLSLNNCFITPDNIEDLFKKAEVPTELDLLSIDIDGNDYWVWQAINNYRPRVVILEYNAIYPPECSWVMQYNPEHVWDYTSHMGSSLKALEKLGEQKGYKLVGCSFAGVNAFFVREDLVGDKFCEPYTAENHYEPARYFLRYKVDGHPRSFGKYKIV